MNKTIQIKASKALATKLNKELKNKGCFDHIRYEEISENSARMVCGICADYSRDYNWNTGMVKTIVIAYKDNCYCSPLYLLTDDLARIIKNEPNVKWDDYVDAFIEEYEI